MKKEVEVMPQPTNLDQRQSDQTVLGLTILDDHCVSRHVQHNPGYGEQVYGTVVSHRSVRILHQRVAGSCECH